ITLHIIDQIRDVDLQRWTPVRGWKIGSHQYTTSSHATTLESNKSVIINALHLTAYSLRYAAASGSSSGRSFKKRAVFMRLPKAPCYEKFSIFSIFSIFSYIM